MSIDICPVASPNGLPYKGRMADRRASSLVVDFTATFGGAFEHALSLVVELEKRDDTDAALVSAMKDKAVLKRVPSTVSLVPFPPYRRYGAEGLRKGIRKYADMAADLVMGEFPRACQLAWIAKRKRANIIHLNNLINIQQSGVLAAKLIGAKSISCHQDFEYDSRLARKAALYVDQHVAISQAIKDDLLQFGVPEDRITIIHNGIDTIRFSPDATRVDLTEEFGVPEGSTTVAIFGRLVDWKGHDDFLRAFAPIAKEIETVHGLIVGDVSDGDHRYEEDLKRLANELDIYDRVTFTGYRGDVPELLCTVDIAVHASNRPEPFGLVVSEAMACGTPIIAMNEGGPPEIVLDGETGFLAEPRNPESISAKLETLVHDPELRARMGAAGRARADTEFSALACANKYAELYQRLLQ